MIETVLLLLLLLLLRIDDPTDLRSHAGITA